MRQQTWLLNYKQIDFAATVDTGSPCHYDEGSPLVQLSPTGDLSVVGIMSKNNGCGPDFLPTIYTRLIEYKVWFNATAGSQLF